MNRIETQLAANTKIGQLLQFDYPVHGANAAFKTYATSLMVSNLGRVTTDGAAACLDIGSDYRTTYIFFLLEVYTAIYTTVYAALYTALTFGRKRIHSRPFGIDPFKDEKSC